MLRSLAIPALTLALLAAAPAAALQVVQQQAPENQPGAVPRATLGWDRIGDVREEQTVVNDLVQYRAVFGAEVKKLDGQPFTVGGFLIPLEQSEKSTHFLLSALSPSCPFCPPPGPADLIEVTATEPVAFTYDMVTLEGTLSLTGDDPNGLYFRLKDAKVKAPS